MYNKPFYFFFDVEDPHNNISFFTYDTQDKDVIDDELVAMIESHLGRKRFKGYKLESIDIQLIGRPTKKKYTV